MNEEPVPFNSNELKEVKKAPSRPDTLYRAFTVNPEDISLEMFTRPLVPGTQAVDDPSRIGDGNERGVYMSTNPYMVEKVYASGGRVEGNFIETPRYVDRGGQENGIVLPVCGVVLEVDTEGLDIREPKMVPALIGHYNNGFEGYEWIADEIPPEHYKLRSLVFSTHPNDREKITIDVMEATEEEKQEALDRIRTEYGKKREQALEYKAFLEGLEPKDRMNEFVLKRKWEQHKSEKIQ
jgi:hypothetical protein